MTTSKMLEVWYYRDTFHGENTLNNTIAKYISELSYAKCKTPLLYASDLRHVVCKPYFTHM